MALYLGTDKVSVGNAYNIDTLLDRAVYVGSPEEPIEEQSLVADKLAVPRKIGNAEFDGSENITLSQIGAQPIVNFSTSEQPTGITWINGKPIYRRCWQVTATLPQGNLYQTYVPSSAISNLDTVVNIRAQADLFGNGGVEFFTLAISGSVICPQYVPGPGRGVELYREVVNSALNGEYPTAEFPITFIVEYTKTTD